MDIIYLRDLQVDAIIGVWEWERHVRQNLILNLELGADITDAAESDDLSDTVDYKAVSDRVIEYTKSTEFQLVESLAEKISEIILGEFSVTWVKLTVGKRGVLPEVFEVGIVIERGEKF